MIDPQPFTAVVSTPSKPKVAKYFIRVAMLLLLLIIGGFLGVMLLRRPVTTNAAAGGLAASFTWNGKGSGAIAAHVTNTSYTGPGPAQVEYGVYWCNKTGNNACAPDLSGGDRADETLIFQNYSLSVPATGQTQLTSLPNVPKLAEKNCGRFQVDLGFPNGGGIIGGQVFNIGDNCGSEPPPPETEKCPYQSTQAQVQTGSRDPWGDQKTITLGQSVNLGGFHNNTGRFAGDPANRYQQNDANVDFFITDPSSTSSLTLAPPYPIVFTPSKVGSFAFVGKTRQNNEYFSESACKDSGTITVVGVPIATPTPPPAGGPTPTPTPTPTSTPTTNTQPECVSLSATPTVGGAQLSVSFSGKGRDTDGQIRQMEFNFGDGGSSTIDVSGGTNSDTVITQAHTYTTSGTYTASLRVKDNSGQGNEWSSTPESCKVKIEVQGQVLGTTTPTTLPKAGVSELLGLEYIIGTIGGVGLKIAARRLRQI